MQLGVARRAAAALAVGPLIAIVVWAPLPAMAQATTTKWVVTLPAQRSAARNSALASRPWKLPNDGP